METEKPKEKFLLKYMTVALRDMEWIFRKSEKHWLDRAGDYDSKYGGTTGYDRGFKRTYLEKATACRQAAETLEKISLSTSFYRSGRFITIVRNMTDVPVSFSDRTPLRIRIDALQKMGKSLINIPG